jgi:cytochrome c biogenesis protein CcmG, thiol:disulfide interchange protein DsbE
MARRAAERKAARRSERRATMRILAAGIAGLVVIAGVTAAVVSSQNDNGAVRASRPQPKPTSAELIALPAPIRANLREANRVVDTSIQAKLAALRGVPVVVNQWASWCPNCKAEFPFFQQLAKRYRGEVAFLGLDSQDSRGNAEDFLKQYPVEYPSIYDQSAAQAQSIGGGQGWPTTIYINKDGRRTFIRPGGYTTLESLDADIRQYAVNG